MAWSFIGVGSGPSADNTVGVSPTVHASTATGDILFLLASGPATRTLAVTGYTELWSQSGAGSTTYLMGKVAGASESAPTVQFSGGAGGIIAQLATFRGGTITAHATGTFSTGTATNITFPSLTISQANTLALILGVKRAGGWTSVDNVSGFTEIAEPDNGTQGIVWNYQIQTTATNVTGSTWTVNGGASGTYVGQTISFLEASGHAGALVNGPAIRSKLRGLVG
jgi:hypothetical protein